MNKGFTLIELLVVISIIGLLSSVFIFSYSDYNERAELSNKMQYAHGIEAQLGAYPAGVWRFDDSTLSDSSGNLNNGTAAGTITYVDGVREGKAVSFISGRIYINNLTETPPNMTLSGWIYKTNASWTAFAFLGKRYGNTGWMLYRNPLDDPGYLRWYSHYNNTTGGISTYVPYPYISGMEVGKWYFITITRDQGGNVRTYLDGKLNSSKTRPSNFSSWSINSYGVSIGSERAGSASWSSEGVYMDEMRIYKEVLPAIVIQQLYAEGIKKHQLVSR